MIRDFYMLLAIITVKSYLAKNYSIKKALRHTFYVKYCIVVQIQFCQTIVSSQKCYPM